MDFETPGDADTLELVSPLFIGGLDANVEAVFLPPVLWSAGFKRGFVGCLRDLVINGQYIFARFLDTFMNIGLNIPEGFQPSQNIKAVGLQFFFHHSDIIFI